MAFSCRVAFESKLEDENKRLKFFLASLQTGIDWSSVTSLQDRSSCTNLRVQNCAALRHATVTLASAHAGDNLNYQFYAISPSP